MRPKAVPVALTMLTPIATSLTDCEISVLISSAALNRRAHFRRDDRKASRHAGPRDLDARVQREQICLERNFVDHADDGADLLG